LIPFGIAKIHNRKNLLFHLLKFSGDKNVFLFLL